MKKSCSMPKKALFWHPAFSLIEMLMALLVASLLLAALAPVMTRKFNDNVNVNGLGEPVKAPADIQCYPYTDTNPEITIPLNDVYYANFVIASGGGGGAGATSETVLNNQTLSTNSTSTSNTINNLIITEDMDDIAIDFMTGGGGGGGGGAVKYATKVVPTAANCQNYGNGKSDTAGNTGANFATYDTKKLCVTKFNQKIGNANGDAGCWSGYAHGPSSVNGKTCTSSAAGVNGIPYTYSGCGRWVCTHPAAVNACSNLATISGDPWRLPNESEMAAWNTTTIWKTLMLCDGTIDSTLSQCMWSKDPLNTINGYKFYATAEDVWSSQGSGEQFLGYYINNNVRAYFVGSPNWFFSTRCVLPATYTFYSISGGGGGASPSVTSANSINEELSTIIKNNIGGSIEIIAGGGGSGGAKASSAGVKAGNGTNGNDSIVRIKNKEGNVVFKITVIGGKYGSGADGSTGTNGSAGAAQDKISISQGCYKQYSESGEKVYFNCTSEGKAGTTGALSVPYANTPSGGGYGGISSFSGASSTGAYYISNITGGTLSDSSNPGSGGGAGRSITSETYAQSIEFTNKHSIGAGGRGAGGFVKITYKRKFPAAGGGGGGAGSVAHIKNFYVGKSSECTLIIGKGGKGGEIDNNGMDGTLSSVKCTNDSRTFIVSGGKGGKKGTPAQNQTSNPAPGLKGVFGDADTYIYSIEPNKREIKKGLDGKDGKYNQTTKQSIGGRGGTSGTGTKGACGGLYKEENICEVSDTDAKRINGKGFTYEDIITPSSQDIQNSIYGTASAGGGGGGWIRALGSGTGGSGMPGYICVYWYGEG